MTRPIGIPAGVLTALAGVAFVGAWSTGFWLAKVDAGAPVVTVMAWRFLVVGSLLALIALLRRRLRSRAARLEAREREARERTAPRVVATQAVVGLLSQTGYVLPVYLAIGFGIASGTSALVDGIQPVLVAVLAGPLLGIAVRRVQWLGLVIALAGVAGLVLLDLDRGTAPPWAYALLLASVLSLVAGTFLERRSPAPMPLLPMLAVHVAVSTTVMLVLATVRGELVPTGGARFWLVVVGLALVPTLAGYGLYWFLLRRIDVTALNALLFLVVPTTTLGGALAFGEPFGPAVLGGVLVTGAGVALVLHGERARIGRGGLLSHARREPVPTS